MLLHVLRRGARPARPAVGIAREERGRDHVHALVRALGGEDGRGHQLVGVAVVQRAGGLGMRLLEDVEDLARRARAPRRRAARPRVRLRCTARDCSRSGASATRAVSVGEQRRLRRAARASRLRRTWTRAHAGRGLEQRLGQGARRPARGVLVGDAGLEASRRAAARPSAAPDLDRDRARRRGRTGAGGGRRARPGRRPRRAAPPRSVRRSRISASSWIQAGGAATAMGSSPAPRAASRSRSAAVRPDDAGERLRVGARPARPASRCRLLERGFEVRRQVRRGTRAAGAPGTTPRSPGSTTSRPRGRAQRRGHARREPRRGEAERRVEAEPALELVLDAPRPRAPGCAPRVPSRVRST